MEETGHDREQQQLEARGYRFELLERLQPPDSEDEKRYYATLWYRSERILHDNTITYTRDLALETMLARAREYEPEEATYEGRQARRRRYLIIFLLVTCIVSLGAGLWLGWEHDRIDGAVTGLLLAGLWCLLAAGVGLVSTIESVSDLAVNLGMFVGPPLAVLMLFSKRPESWSTLIWLPLSCTAGFFAGGLLGGTLSSVIDRLNQTHRR